MTTPPVQSADPPSVRDVVDEVVGWTVLGIVFLSPIVVCEMVLGFMPSMSAYLLMWGVFALCLLIRWHAKRSGWRLGLLLVVSALFIGAYWMPWNSRKPFLRRLSQIKQGMTAAEVESIMSGYMRGTGWAVPPDMSAADSTLTEIGSGVTMQTQISPSGELMIRDSITFRHSNSAAYGSDWGVVRFRDGKVVDVAFMPD